MERPPPRSDALRPQPGRGVRDDEVELGFVAGVFGVRGEVRLHLHNPSSELLDRPRVVGLVSPEGERFTARLRARPGAGKRVLGLFEGLTDRDQAAALQGYKVVVDQAALPPLEEGEYYLWQLEGAEAVIDGQPVGRVARVHATGPVEVLEVHTPGGGVSFVPSLKEFVRSVDTAAGRVELAPGALDEDE